MSEVHYTQPIINTDIWVFLIQSGFDQRLIQRYGFIFVSDTVEQEILKWKRNHGESQSIALKFEDYKEAAKIRVIDYDSFDSLEQSIINHQLKDYGLQHVGIIEKNKGEFVSLLYALHKELKIFKTNDRNFLNEIEKSIHQQITITNWDALLDKYSSSIKEKAEARRVTENRQNKMKEQKIQNRDPRWDALKALVG